MGRGLLLAGGLAFLVFCALTIFSDVQALKDSLNQYLWWYTLPALGLALGNYLLRFARWEYYLRHQKIDAGGLRTSFAIFCSGLVMSITPGKVGELLKSFLLLRTTRVPVGKSAPVVVAERMTDVFAVLLLCLGGLAWTRYGLHVVALVGGVCFGGLVIVLHRPISMAILRILERLPGLRRFVPTMREAYDGMVALLHPVPVLIATGLGLMAWGFEGVALYVVLQGFPDVDAGVGLSVFVYAFATLAGAASLLPGGVVFTEGILFALLFHVFAVTGDAAVATAATIIIRFCTLWFAVMIGFVAFLRLRRKLGFGSADALISGN